MKASICIVSVVVLTLGSTPILRAERQAPKAGGAIPNPHHHAKGEDVLKEVAPEIKVVESSMPQNAETQNLVLNKSEKFSSFTVTTEEGLERIFVRQVIIPNRSERLYEIRGVAWPNRPLSDPHAAIHYVFDMQKRVLVEARAFSE
jgi:hypothetical protein